MAVTPSTIATALGVVSPEPGSLTYEQWSMWIEDAYRLIEERRVEQDAPVIPAEKLDYAVKEAVVAHARKPDDATTVTIAVDDGSSSRRYESGKGRVTLDDWWDYLGLGGETGDAFTVRPAGRTADEVCPW
jgi:hypothetical protein